MLGKSLVLVKSLLAMSFSLLWSGFSPVFFICDQEKPAAIAFWFLIHLMLFLFKLQRFCSKCSKISMLVLQIFNERIWMWQYRLFCAGTYEWASFTQNVLVNIGQQHRFLGYLNAGLLIIKFRWWKVLFILYAEHSGCENKFQTYLYSSVITLTRSRKAGQGRNDHTPTAGRTWAIRAGFNEMSSPDIREARIQETVAATHGSQGAKSGRGAPQGRRGCLRAPSTAHAGCPHWDVQGQRGANARRAGSVFYLSWECLMWKVWANHPGSGSPWILSGKDPASHLPGGSTATQAVGQASGLPNFGSQVPLGPTPS